MVEECKFCAKRYLSLGQQTKLGLLSDKISIPEEKNLELNSESKKNISSRRNVGKGD